MWNNPFFFGVFTGSDNWTSDKNKTELALRTHSTKLNVPQQNTVKYDLTTSNLVIWQTTMSQIDETTVPIGRCHGVGEGCDESASPFHLLASCVCCRWPIRYISVCRWWCVRCLDCSVRQWCACDIEKPKSYGDTVHERRAIHTHLLRALCCPVASQRKTMSDRNKWFMPNTNEQRWPYQIGCAHTYCNTDTIVAHRQAEQSRKNKHARSNHLFCQLLECGGRLCVVFANRLWNFCRTKSLREYTRWGFPIIMVHNIAGWHIKTRAQHLLPYRMHFHVQPCAAALSRVSVNACLLVITNFLLLRLLSGKKSLTHGSSCLFRSHFSNVFGSYDTTFPVFKYLSISISQSSCNFNVQSQYKIAFESRAVACNRIFVSDTLKIHKSEWENLHRSTFWSAKCS